MGLMDNTPTGRLIRNVMLAFAEFERDMIVERTSEGKAIAEFMAWLRNPDILKKIVPIRFEPAHSEQTVRQ